MCVSIHDVAQPFTCGLVRGVRGQAVSIVSDRPTIVLALCCDHRIHRRRSTVHSGRDEAVFRHLLGYKQVTVGISFVSPPLHARKNRISFGEAIPVRQCIVTASGIILQKRFLGGTRFCLMLRRHRQSAATEQHCTCHHRKQ